MFRPPRRNNVRLLLLMDVGGTMDPYFEPMSRLLTALREEHGLRELRAYYFHNCIYDRVYKTATLRRDESLPTGELFRALDARWKVLIVGDAAMHPAELLEAYGNIDPREETRDARHPVAAAHPRALRARGVAEPRPPGLLGRRRQTTKLVQAHVPDVPPERRRALRGRGGAGRRAARPREARRRALALARSRSRRRRRARSSAISTARAWLRVAEPAAAEQARASSRSSR